MPTDADDPFQPRLGRLRTAGSPRGRRYLHVEWTDQVSSAAARPARASTSSSSRPRRGFAPTSTEGLKLTVRFRPHRAFQGYFVDSL